MCIRDSLKTVELTQKYTDTSEHTYTPDWSEIPTGQTWSYNKMCIRDRT